MAEHEDNGMVGKTVASPTDMTNDATQNPPGPSTLPGNVDLQTTLLTVNTQMSPMAEILSQLYTNSSDGQGRKRSRPKRTHEAATSSSSADSDSSSDNDSDKEPIKKWKVEAPAEEDKVSVYASQDEDVENLLKDKCTKTVSGAEGAKKNNDETFLKELADQLDDCESSGLDVNAQLAAIVNKCWSKKLAHEKLKPLLDEYKKQKTPQLLSRPRSTLKSGVSCSRGKRDQILR